MPLLTPETASIYKTLTPPISKYYNHIGDISFFSVYKKYISQICFANEDPLLANDMINKHFEKFQSFGFQISIKE